MAVSYAPTKLRVPPGFQNLLEGLAREVLREQPEDILSFAAQYFKTQLAIREETGNDDAKKGADMEKLMKGEAVDMDESDPGLNEAATKIQASFRGHKVRKGVQEKKEAEAAVKIQASFRGHQTRKELNKPKEGGEEAQGDEETSEPAPEAKEDTKEEVKEETTEDATAEATEETKEEVKEETKEEAKEETKAEGEDEVDIDLADPEVQKAALTIQSSFRGHKARENVKAMKTDNTEGETQVPEEPETPAQEAVPETQTEEVDIDLEDPEVQKAALTIQSSFRGHKAREDVKKLKTDTDISEEKGDEAAEAAPAADEAQEKPAEETPAEETPAEAEEVDIDLNDPEVAKAATTIQASFRGHQIRKQMKEGEGEPEKTEQEEPAEEKAEEPAEAQGEEAS